MQAWAESAHLEGLKCHVGRIGSYAGYLLCHYAGIDSVDGTYPSRNQDERPLKRYYEHLAHQSNLKDFEILDEVEALA
jgi:hypothetical protein